AASSPNSNPVRSRNSRALATLVKLFSGRKIGHRWRSCSGTWDSIPGFQGPNSARLTAAASVMASTVHCLRHAWQTVDRQAPGFKRGQRSDPAPQRHGESGYAATHSPGPDETGRASVPLEIDVHPQRLMIGTRGVGVDACRLHPARQCSRNKAEVDPLAVVGCHAFVLEISGSDPGI